MNRKLKKRVFAGMIAAAAILAAAVFYPRESAYRRAVRLQTEGKTVQAYREYLRLGRWRDSEERAASLREDSPGIALAGTERWEKVQLGQFEQDGDPENGPEPLEWIVLYREEEESGGTRLLLLSQDCIACTAFHTSAGEITWEESALREYLNRIFLEKTFDAQEQDLIRAGVRTLSEEDSASIGGGPESFGTEDAVFLLSAEEYSIYFQQEEMRWVYGRAQASGQAQKEGIYLSGQDRTALEEEEEGYTRWWLRSPGNEAYSAQFVEEDGGVFEGGAAVDIDYTYGLRPALWVYVEE